MAEDKIIQRKGSKSKKVMVIALVCLALILCVGIAYSVLNNPYDRTVTTFKKVTITEEDDTAAIADKLAQKHIIGDADRFIFFSDIMLCSGKYQPGLYYLSPSMNTKDICNTMVNGITTKNGFTVPAGYSVKQLAKSLDQAGYVDKDAFVECASELDFSSFSFIDAEAEGVDSIEGFLLPGKYEVIEDANEAMIIMTMLDSFDNFFNTDFRIRCEELGMSVRELITLASVIEQTTSIDKERAHISSVLHNRLNLGLDLYRDGGLNGPICSPGKDSIIAALYPDESQDLYYVLSDKLDGTHLFTDDEEEFKQLTENYEQALSNREVKNDKMKSGQVNQ